MKLAELTRARGLKHCPPCFYCGAKATEVDHRTPRRQLGRATLGNLHPACRRCNTRKNNRSIAVFRRHLERAARAVGRSDRVVFYGEGARGSDLRRLRFLLGRVVVVKGVAVVRAPGWEPKPISEAASARAKERKATRALARWPGRLTFTGQRAIRALCKATGCSALVVEHFMLGMRTNATKDLERAAAKLKLPIEDLREHERSIRSTMDAILGMAATLIPE